MCREARLSVIGADVGGSSALLASPLHRRFLLEVRELAVLGWPQTVTSVVGFAPRIFLLSAVAHLPEGELLVGAAGIGSMVCNVSQLMLIRSSTFGAAPLLSQAHGAGNSRRVGTVLMRLLAIHVACMLCFSLPLTAVAGPLLAAAGQPSSVVANAQRFVWIRLLGLPGVTANVDLAAFLNAQRCVRLPMLVNAALSPLQVGLVIGLTRSFGFDGAPLAMTITELLAGLLIWLAAPVVLRRHRLRSWPRWRGEGRQALRGWSEIVSKGAPAAAMTMSEWAGWECTLFVASGLCGGGAAACAVTAAIPICTTVFVCEFLLVFGWGLAACNRIGNLLGEGKGQEARFSGGVALVAASLSSITLAVVVVSNRRRIATFFVEGESEEAAAVLETTVSLMPVTTLYSVLATLAPGWSQQVLFGLGADLRAPATLNIFAFFAVGVPGGSLLAYRFGMGVQGIWLGLVAAIGLVVVGQHAHLARTTDWPEMARVARARALQREGAEATEGDAVALARAKEPPDPKRDGDDGLETLGTQCSRL